MYSTDNSFQHQGIDEHPMPASDSTGYNTGNTQWRSSQSSLTTYDHDIPNPQYPSQLLPASSNHRLLGYTSNPIPTLFQGQTARYQSAYVPDNDLALDNTFNTPVPGRPPTSQPKQQSLNNPIDNFLRDTSHFGDPPSEDPFLVQPYQIQNAQRLSNISQTKPHQQMKAGNNFEYAINDLSNEPNLVSTSSATNPSFPLTRSTSPSKNKKRKLEDHPRRKVYPGEGAENIQGDEGIPRLDDTHIVTILYCIWRAAFPSVTPETSDYVVMGEICGVSIDAVESIFESIQNRRTQPGQNSPDPISSLAVKLWLCRNPGKKPPDLLLTGIGKVFNSQFETLQRYATRNVRGTNNMRDSTINKSLYTTRSSIKEAPSHAGEPQISCKSAARRSGRMKPRCEWKRDPQKIFLCTYCGQTFARKGDWKRHENRICLTESWRCGMCPTEIWSRKDQTIEHKRRFHQREPEEPIILEGVLSYSDFRKQCMFRTCNSTFNTFEGSFEHRAKCFEERKDWDHKDLRDDEGESVSEDLLNGIEKSPPERHDDGDGPGGSTDKGSGDTNGGNNDSPSRSGSPGSFVGPPSSQISGSYGGFAHTSLSFDGNGNYTSASDALPVIRECQPESTTWGNILQLTQSWSSQFHVLGRLGSGGRAVVDEVWVKGYTRTMALKTFSSSLQNSSREWRREVEAMAKLKEHPHIVKLVRVCLRQNSPALLIQSVADYDLDKYLGSYTATLKEQRNIWLWFSCLASGLEHIHEHGVLHNDIKPQNILVEDQRVLFADFGSSSTIDETRQLKMRAFHHTKLYAAPEVEQGDYTTASDVWSLGCVFIEMVTALISWDMWTQLRAFQSSLYHQPMSVHNWALEWTKQILLYSHGQAIGNHLEPILEVCGKMTQLEHEKRPNAADLYRQINSELDCHCDYETSVARQSDKSLSRKRPNQDTERQSKRLAQPRDFKAAGKSTNVTVRSGLLDVDGISTLRSKLSGWKHWSLKPRRKRPVKTYIAAILSDVDSCFSDIAVGEPSKPSAFMGVSWLKNGDCDASPSRLKPVTMLDRFLDDSNELEHFKVSGSKHNVHERRMRHSSELSTLIKSKSLPLSTECAVITKTRNNGSWNCSSNCSVPYRMTKDIGTQFSSCQVCKS